ncbi:MAG: family 43 glycosylhydrolase [Prevotellaceae bacterium]|nr:family 43 glycosylhydrolase [Candidatus Minthosoma caballi]
MKKLLVLLFLPLAIASNAQPGGFREMPKDIVNPDVHDPVMAYENGKYYLFGTGMGVSVLSSSDMKTWNFEKPVFEIKYAPFPPGTPEGVRPRRIFDKDNSTIPTWALDSIRNYAGHTWAPDISFHDGLWRLYYSCSSFGKNGSGIGVAVNKTLDPKSPDFKWEDQGPVIISHQHVDNYNCIDPNLIVDAKGTPWLTFGSFWDGIQIVKLEKDYQTLASKPKTISRRIGKKVTLAEIDNIEHYTIEGNDTIEAGENAVEAPFIIKNGKYYYLFVSFDYCCRGEKSTYRTVVGRSKKVDGPYLDKKGVPMEKGGGETIVGPNQQFFGAGHNSAYKFNGQWYFVSHAYVKAENGRAKLLLRKMTFDKNGWPSIEL